MAISASALRSDSYRLLDGIAETGKERSVESVGQDWICDPFDRLIVAQAHVSGTKRITKDRTIRKHYEIAVW